MYTYIHEGTHTYTQNKSKIITQTDTQTSHYLEKLLLSLLHSGVTGITNLLKSNVLYDLVLVKV